MSPLSNNGIPGQVKSSHLYLSGTFSTSLVSIGALRNDYYRIYSLRHRKCFVRGFIHELFVSKALTRSYLARSGF